MRVKKKTDIHLNIYLKTKDFSSSRGEGRQRWFLKIIIRILCEFFSNSKNNPTVSSPTQCNILVEVRDSKHAQSVKTSLESYYKDVLWNATKKESA